VVDFLALVGVACNKLRTRGLTKKVKPKNTHSILFCDAAVPAIYNQIIFLKHGHSAPYLAVDLAKLLFSQPRREMYLHPDSAAKCSALTNPARALLPDR